MTIGEFLTMVLKNRADISRLYEIVKTFRAETAPFGSVKAIRTNMALGLEAAGLVAKLTPNVVDDKAVEALATLWVQCGDAVLAIAAPWLNLPAEVGDMDVAAWCDAAKVDSHLDMDAIRGAVQALDGSRIAALIALFKKFFPGDGSGIVTLLEIALKILPIILAL